MYIKTILKYKSARTSGNVEAYTTNRLKDEAANHVMSDEEAYDAWMINVRWNTYKKKVVVFNSSI